LSINFLLTGQLDLLTNRIWIHKTHQGRYTNTVRYNGYLSWEGDGRITGWYGNGKIILEVGKGEGGDGEGGGYLGGLVDRLVELWREDDDDDGEENREEIFDDHGELEMRFERNFNIRRQIEEEEEDDDGNEEEEKLEEGKGEEKGEEEDSEGNADIAYNSDEANNEGEGDVIDERKSEEEEEEDGEEEGEEEEEAEEEEEEEKEGAETKKRGGSSPSRTRSSVDNNDEKDVCKICFVNDINCVIIPCGHFANCLSCGKRLRNCPICRQPIMKVQEVFRA